MAEYKSRITGRIKEWWKKVCIEHNCGADMRGEQGLSELKPCPFCGGEPTIESQDFGIMGVIRCTKCNKLFAFRWNEAETMLELVNAWNSRWKDGEG